MAKYIFVYHGGKMPESEEEIATVMASWKSWLTGMGSSCVDPGNPVGMSSTVNSDGSVANDGGANPISGYTVVEAADQNQANDLAKGCPVLESGGSVEVAMIVEMDM